MHIRAFSLKPAAAFVGGKRRSFGNAVWKGTVDLDAGGRRFLLDALLRFV